MIAIDVTSAATAVPAINEAARTGRILLFHLENMFISPIFFSYPVLSKEKTDYGFRGIVVWSALFCACFSLYLPPHPLVALPELSLERR